MAPAEAIMVRDANAPVFSGEDAVAMSKLNPYDLVLMDMQMAGINGITALQEIKAGEQVEKGCQHQGRNGQPEGKLRGNRAIEAAEHAAQDGGGRARNARHQ